MNERLGRWSFWTMFVGFNIAFFPMHIAGLVGMRRRVFTYTMEDGITWVNAVSSIGALVLAVGVLLTIVNAVRRSGWIECSADPWGGDTLEWTVPSPPPEYNFAVLPRVRSLHPAWDEPAEAAADLHAEGHRTPETTVVDAVDQRMLEMPHASAVPALAALAMLAFFSAVLVRWWWPAAACLVATGVVIGVWQHDALAHSERSAA